MKTEITLTITKDCTIFCNVFRFRLPELLAYYMRHVRLATFLESAEEKIHPATTFFTMHGWQKTRISNW